MRALSRALIATTLVALSAGAQGPPAQNRPPAADTARVAGDSAGGRRAATAPTRDIVAMTTQPPVVLRKSISARGQTINYTSTAGMLPIRNNETGVVEGGMFFMAYNKDGQSAATRPITFIFNGGPGSSSVWLHLGAWGPKRVRLMPDGNAPPPPYTFEDNPHTLLDVT